VARKSWMQRLNLVPIGAGICDVLENVAIVALLARYPARLDGIVWFSTALTICKLCLFGVSLILVLLGVIGAVTRRGR
jgi:hypothetical protein